MATTTTPSYEDHHLEQILSLLNDQQECLTLRTIMLELTVTRSVARDILEEVVKRTTAATTGTGTTPTSSGDKNMKYEVVRMIPKKSSDGKRTIMELIIVDPNSSDDINNTKGTIFSISVSNNDDVTQDDDDVM